MSEWSGEDEIVKCKGRVNDAWRGWVSEVDGTVIEVERMSKVEQISEVEKMSEWGGEDN